MDSVTIVGAGVVGYASAKALRGQGFTGRITIVGGERHRPYDRPPLGRGFLTGQTTIGELALEAPTDDLHVDWRLGVAAVALDAATRRVTLADGSALDADTVVLTTGSTARRIGDIPHGVHTLRTVDDALALREELLPGARMVVVGSGIVGLEAASTARDLGLDVTVLGSTTDALRSTFGDTVAEAVFAQHARRGIVVRTDLRVDSLLGPNWVSGVRLATGEEIGADLVLLDIGSEAQVDWLADSGLDLGPGVLCDETGATSAPGIVAVGDCAAWFDPMLGRHRRIAHWSDSRNRAAIATAALRGVDPGPSVSERILSTEQAGSRVQFAGRLRGREQFTVQAGSVATNDLFAVYRLNGEPVAALAVNQPALMSEWHSELIDTTKPAAPTAFPPASAGRVTRATVEVDAPVRDASALA